LFETVEFLASLNSLTEKRALEKKIKVVLKEPEPSEDADNNEKNPRRELT